MRAAKRNKSFLCETVRAVVACSGGVVRPTDETCVAEALCVSNARQIYQFRERKREGAHIYTLTYTKTYSQLADRELVALCNVLSLSFKSSTIADKL